MSNFRRILISGFIKRINKKTNIHSDLSLLINPESKERSKNKNKQIIDFVKVNNKKKFLMRSVR